MQGTPELDTLCTRIYIGSTTSTTAAAWFPISVWICCPRHSSFQIDTWLSSLSSNLQRA
jgi:hypothetical protein